MSHDDPFRELTPEEAEAAYRDAPEADIPPEEMASLIRKTFILIGAVPLSEMTPDEVEWHIRHNIRFSRESPAVTADVVQADAADGQD